MQNDKVCLNLGAFQNQSIEFSSLNWQDIKHVVLLPQHAGYAPSTQGQLSTGHSTADHSSGTQGHAGTLCIT